ncbi:uncharacterized protein BO80DRAFT_357049 [Aspergillus ibericus CBS 121593]|uniref:AHC1-like C2H2 zinc-finger domain-containing protein n=1 Tax=Aspergillus ibericus CBS 121593 TaxID=1448316 RepID=A0A395GXG9_9EURO|nr:hypothetical protein BO80DRAFT_357049 [Aspergillus ibericus CBS 121593]RAL00302.1 hypothetical protein BO80DRAFT_357049 [Aspergillus ibericus CBS 121593]
MLATSPHCAAPGLAGLPLPQLKRKRSDSSDPISARDAPVATKLRADDTPSNSIGIKSSFSPAVNTTTTVSHEPGGDGRAEPISESSHMSQLGQSAIASESPITNQNNTRKIDVDTLRETLEAQLSLEVLLKHNELRLIDQEIAKCQVALEQLRRCAEIPYPGSCVAGYSPSVSNGTGAAVWAPENGPAPQSPAPWGVMEGPYSRHYSRWLLPDPRFDGGDLEPGTPLAGLPLLEGRTTRGSSGDLGYLAGKTRPQRGSGGVKLQSLPNGYPPPKEKAGPMLIRRKSDNVLVKLVCLDCRRDNFSSTQGFINHCRIAHNRNFASHDAAAVASGEPVEVDEAGAVVGGKNEISYAATAGYVHPLIRSAHGIEPSKTPSSTSEAAGDQATPRKRSGPSRRASSGVETPRTLARPPAGAAPGAWSDSFMGSPATPHLSSLMQSRGVGLDLDRLVGEAKTVVDLGEYSSDEGESDAESVPPPVAMSHEQTAAAVRAGRQPMRTTASQTAPQHPSSHKGPEKTIHKPPPLETLTPTKPAPYPSAYGPVPCASRSTQLDELREERASNLSPNTIESNQAPSLVSDDDDYEAASDSESPGPSSSEAGDPEDFGHIDVEDDDEHSTTSTAAPEAKSDMGMASAAPQPPLAQSFRRSIYRPKQTSLQMPFPPTTMDLNPATISPSTFQHLLALYPVTVDARARDKTTEKFLSRKSSSKAKKTKTKPAAAETNVSGLLTPDQQSQIDTEVAEFLSLDRFRYEDLPGLVAARAKDPSSDEPGNGYIEKDELVRLVEWKMKHGIFRPALLGLIRSNPETLVRKVTGEAFAALTTTATKEEGEVFPAKALDLLVKPLRGVGVATASLILSLAAPAGGGGGVPFYSDDVYLWVCLGESAPQVGGVAEERVHRGIYKRVNGELNVRYDAKEYRALWEGVQGLRKGLGGSCSGLEVEKVALVVRYRGLEGVEGDEKAPLEVKKEEEEEKGEKGEIKRGAKRALELSGEEGTGRRRSKRLSRG